MNLYNKIAFEVATEIEALITPEEKQLIQKTPTANPYAYYFYQRGKDQFDNYNDSISLVRSHVIEALVVFRGLVCIEKISTFD